MFAPLGFMPGMTKEQIAAVAGAAAGTAPVCRRVEHYMKLGGWFAGTPEELVAYLKDIEARYPGLEHINLSPLHADRADGRAVPPGRRARDAAFPRPRAAARGRREIGAGRTRPPFPRRSNIYVRQRKDRAAPGRPGRNARPEQREAGNAVAEDPTEADPAMSSPITDERLRH